MTMRWCETLLIPIFNKIFTPYKSLYKCIKSFTTAVISTTSSNSIYAINFQFRLLELNSLSSLNEIFREIATRVNDNSLSSTLSDLLVIYNVDVITREEVHSIVIDNLLWLHTHTNDIRRFLDDFHHSTSASSSSLPFKAISYLVITFGLASNWIMSHSDGC